MLATRWFYREFNIKVHHINVMGALFFSYLHDGGSHVTS